MAFFGFSQGNADNPYGRSNVVYGFECGSFSDELVSIIDEAMAIKADIPVELNLFENVFETDRT